MTDQPNLFKSAAYNELGPLEVTRVERVVIDRYVAVAGIQFDLEDLYTTLCEVEHGGVWITNDSYKLFVELGVLSSLGSGRGYAASEGENFADFLERVRAAYYSEKNS